ncbi:hypothetical protein [Alcaligenes aquatilis]|uniref:hypothetical protein n=1 Tax=Alcaligenes aquatilis TaxID=323284 RepID=UPI0013CE55E8|nr:hypothetical protein [Alcaligenes aquatilis]
MQKKQLKSKKPASLTTSPAERFNLDRTAEVYGDRPLHALRESRVFSYQEYRKNQEP